MCVQEANRLFINTINPLLSPTERKAIDDCVVHYSDNSKTLSNLLFRLWNAVKHIFGASDWDAARNVVETKLLSAKMFLGEGNHRVKADNVLRALVVQKLAERVSDNLRSTPNQKPTYKSPVTIPTPPLVIPSVTPTLSPSAIPSAIPSFTPSVTPLVTPTDTPSDSSLNTPSDSPVVTPLVTPTDSPLDSPSNSPADSPAVTPSVSPRSIPHITLPSRTIVDMPILRYKLPKPQAGGIQMQLINYGEGFANMCWLNSAIMFMASTTLFDELLNLESHKVPHQYQELHETLRRIVRTLREGTDRAPLSQEEYLPLVFEVKALMPSDGPDSRTTVGRDQLDPLDFFRRLAVAFAHPVVQRLDKGSTDPIIRETCVQSSSVYKSLLPNSFKNPNRENFESVLSVELPVEEYERRAEVNLFEEYSRPAGLKDIELTRLVDIEGTSFEAPQMGSALRCRKLTNLPTQLMIYFNRLGSANGMAHDEGVEKCNRDIAIGPNATFEVEEYDPTPVITSEGERPCLLPRFKCTYRVAAAITQWGQSSHGGHYVCSQVTKEGRLLLHDDRGSPAAVGKAKDLQQASLLILERVSKVPYTSEEINSYISAINPAAPQSSG